MKRGYVGHGLAETCKHKRQCFQLAAQASYRAHAGVARARLDRESGADRVRSCLLKVSHRRLPSLVSKFQRHRAGRIWWLSLSALRVALLTFREVCRGDKKVLSPASRMAASSRTWEEAVTRWSRVGELGMEAALREIGCSEERISKALKENNGSWIRSDWFERISDVREAVGARTSGLSDTADAGEEGDTASDDSEPNYTELERSTILATVGRGSSRVETVRVVEVTENEATAFCVNLTSNTNVSDISFQDEGNLFSSGTGGTLLAKAFATNLAVKKLTFRLDVGSEGLSCLMKAVQLSKTLEEQAFVANSRLRNLMLYDVDVGSEGVRCLVRAMQLSKTLEEVYLSFNPLGDDGVTLVAEFLANSTTLKRLDLDSVGCGLEGAKHLSSALARNTSLECLTFSISYMRFDSGVHPCYKECQRREYKNLKENPTLGASLVEGYRMILESLSLDGEDAPLSQTAPKNSTLTSLDLSMPDILQHVDPTYLECLTSILKRNQTLCKLDLREFELPPQVWKELFFPALKENATLKRLALHNCQGLSGDVFEAIMDVLQNSRTGLEELILGGTKLEDKQSQVDEELRINKEYRSTLRGQPLVSTTSGRLVLCGKGFGGKTEISKTMLRIDNSAPPPHPLKTGWKTVLQTFPALQRLLFGKDAYRELMSRTRGCDISGLENQLPVKSIWDFAGQKEYYALHDYLFPYTKNSCFLFVCSSRCAPDPKFPKGIIKSKKTMREECAYWMKFIASNSKIHIGRDGQGLQLPHVVFVLTKKDTLNSVELGFSKANANSVVKDLRSEFDGVVDLCEDARVVDARNAQDVTGLFTVVKAVLGKILKTQTEYAICQEVREILGRWSADNVSKPVLNLDEYYKLCQDQLKTPYPLVPNSESQRGSKASRDVVLAYLNDLGEVISLPGLGFIVTNPRWFGVGVLGSLINAFKGIEDRTGLLNCYRPTLDVWGPPKDGFVDREAMKALLEHSLRTMELEQPLTTDQLTDLMILLEMCYKKDSRDADSSLFMPALFDDPTDSAAEGKRKLQWKLKETEILINLGRRLSCKDKSKTFLTPGFFPRWQVHMLNLLHQKDWASNPAFRIGRNLIGFSQNGIEVLIEYSGNIDYFVDILVRSSKPHAEALKFIETDVLHNIRQFCASPQGCQGVVLETSVIRPACVQNLDKCVDRKDQVVLISLLQDKLTSDLGYKHTWKVPRAQESDTSYALDLLEGKDSFISKHKSRGDCKPDIASSSAASSSHRDDLPKLIYPTIDDVGMFRRFVTSLNLRKTIPIKLHLQCDNKDGSHEVEKQPGRTYILNWKDGGVNVPIAKHLVTLLYSAAGVGATIAGAPFALPSIDNLLKLFDAPEMPAIELETLQQRMNPAQSLGPVSNEDICAALRRYMERDPHALGLKKFLNLDDSNKFWNDFQLHRVIYTEAPHQGRIGWVCDCCYWDGFNDRILASVSS